jgi:hypothetical protein
MYKCEMYKSGMYKSRINKCGMYMCGIYSTARTYVCRYNYNGLWPLKLRQRGKLEPRSVMSCDYLSANQLTAV